MDGSVAERFPNEGSPLWRPLRGLAKGASTVKNFVNRAKDFLRSEDGPTATEYAVMLALIIVAAITAIGTIGDKVSASFAATDAALGGEL
mgnify:CR=1 FL=1